MRILMVNKFLYPNGGSETYMFSLGAHLEGSGHEVQYFGMEDDRNIAGNSAGSYTSNMDFHASGGGLKKLAYPFKLIYSTEARRKIRAVIREFKPDIAHLNNINFQITPSVIYELRKHKIPIVQTVHDYQMICPVHSLYNAGTGQICEKCIPGKFSNCFKDKCTHGSRARSLIAALESYYYHWRKTYHLVDRYIAPSEFLAGKLRQGGIPKDKISAMHNFVTEGTITEEQASEKYALYFGRFSHEKGTQTLIDVCKELPDIRFIFAGTGPLVELLSDVQNIRYVGFISGDALTSLIRNAAFSLCPSECHENCPLSVLESQALGTPVIGSDHGGIPELIDYGKSGLVYKGGDRTALKAAMRTLWDDDEMRETMSAYCRTKPQVTVDEYAARIMNMYTSLARQ